MRPLLPIFALLTGCGWFTSPAPPPPEEPDPCPANQVGCAFEMGWMRGDHDDNRCREACIRWSEREPVAAVQYICRMREDGSTSGSRGFGLHYLLTPLMWQDDPEHLALMLKAAPTQGCSAEDAASWASYIADRAKEHPELDWTPVGEVAASLNRVYGPRQGFETLRDLAATRSPPAKDSDR